MRVGHPPVLDSRRPSPARLDGAASLEGPPVVVLGAELVNAGVQQRPHSNRLGGRERLTATPATPHHAAMATQKKRKPTGRLVDVARVVSVGQDRKTGEAVLRFRDTNGSLVAVRLRPRQFRPLARGVLGLAEARSGD